MSDVFKIRVVSPWFGELKLPQAHFSTAFSTEESDALLCDWAPADELLSCAKRKAWYCCEPYCQFRGLGRGSWPGQRKALRDAEFLSHNHEVPCFRVPHVTHFETLTVDHRGDRSDRAVAIVSNHGGNPWKAHADLRYRSQFITHDLVDLYGRSAWKKYRKGRFSLPSTPRNYKGEIPGDWPGGAKRDLMASYQVAVCLENMSEAYYFTEKFIEAVCAGCVPVYRAHPSVAAGVLKGAIWFDPADYGHEPALTINAALASNANEVRRVNEKWLAGEAVAATHHSAVFARIAAILQSPVA